MRGLSKAHESMMNNPELREMVAAQEATGIVETKFKDTEFGAFAMNDLMGAFQGEDQLKYLLAKYKDLANDEMKLARKLLKAIRDYPDRPSLHVDIMFYLFDGSIGDDYYDTTRKKDDRLWKACYASPIMTEKLFDAVRVIIETDIRRLKLLRSGMQDIHLGTKPLAWGVIPKCFHTADGKELHFGAAKLFFSSCWKLHLDLCLALWRAIGLGFTVPMDSQIIEGWAVSCQLLRIRSMAAALFEGAQRADGKPFHDSDSPTLGRFLDLLDIQGDPDFLCKFKPNIYLAAALLVLHAQRLENDGAGNLISASELKAVITRHLDRPPDRMRAAFFTETVVIFAEKALETKVVIQFEKFVEGNDVCKRCL